MTLGLRKSALSQSAGWHASPRLALSDSHRHCGTLWQNEADMTLTATACPLNKQQDMQKNV
jgi:hypothetical protein